MFQVAFTISSFVYNPASTYDNYNHKSLFLHKNINEYIHSLFSLNLFRTSFRFIVLQKKISLCIQLHLQSAFYNLLHKYITHYTLHITHYTLHITHYTLHITLYTLHITHNTLHITHYT